MNLRALYLQLPLPLRQFIKYCGVGGINTLVGVGLMAWGAQLGWHYMVYTAVSYLLAMVLSFMLNAFLTFRTHNELWPRFQRFMLVNIGNMLAVQVLQTLLIEYAGWREFWGVATGMVLYTLAGFALNKYLVYQAR